MSWCVVYFFYKNFLRQMQTESFISLIQNCVKRANPAEFFKMFFSVFSFAARNFFPNQNVALYAPLLHHPELTLFELKKHFFHFIFIFIRLIRWKESEAQYTAQAITSTCFRRCQRYCCPVKI